METLIASTTNATIKKQLKISKWFTPSTIGNVVIANTEPTVYVISNRGDIKPFDSTVRKMNRKLFLDRLKDYNPS